MHYIKITCLLFLPAAIISSCGASDSGPSSQAISDLKLKRGAVISCGTGDKNFGTVEFELVSNATVKGDFNTAVELLHSFEYDEAEKVFARIIDQAPNCAMAYWGVAMCCFHPLWEPPTEGDLKKGTKAIEIASTLEKKTPKEAAYINALSEYYKNWQHTDPHTRSVHFEKAMERLHDSFPIDNEAAIFYALALDAAVDPTDKNYSNQKKAGAILEQLYAREPNHPGIIHYIIHTYDYPGLATLALPAARRYAGVAPSSAHALHMPSHIFTRLGLWEECISSNRQSVAAAKCYAGAARIKGNWDEELHGTDYLEYAYLQKGDNAAANDLVNYLSGITEVYPANFKVAYAFAAVPSRFLLENKKWDEAARLPMHPANFKWNKFPWQEAIFHFTRLLGSVHTRQFENAHIELLRLYQLRDTLQRQKDFYKAKQLEVQAKTGEAWIQFAKGKNVEALKLMTTAADMEDSTSKHPVTPGEVLPARELLGDMFMERGENKMALQCYEAVLLKSPNRFNSVYGAARAAENLRDIPKATAYYRQLASTIDLSTCNRPEVVTIKSFLKDHH